MDLLRLYDYAEQHDIRVDWLPMQMAQSLSIQLTDGTCAVALDPWQLSTSSDEKVKLAHELGHCETGSFYNIHAPCDVRQKHENRADKWAIKELIPEDELNKAVSHGITEIWDLAEHFGVTEDFMRKAVCWYTHGTLDTDRYFIT